MIGLSPSLLLIAASLVPAPSPQTIAAIRRYAIVIGVNQPAHDGQMALNFADDDAVRFHALFQQLSGEASLFSLLDDETQRVYPEVVSEAEIPTKALILTRIRHMFERMASDREQAVSTEFYFVYSGHGYVDEHGEGHLGLRDGSLSRTELYGEILAHSTAQMNHIIVDACDAYFFVQSRGGDKGEIERLLQTRANDYLDRQSLERYPNTGAVLSTASAAESHEWSEIRAGVFSHEVRSALLGAADANEDHHVSYQELEAFILSANAGVEHIDAERAVFVRPPASDHAYPVIDLNAVSRAHRLRLPKNTEGRIALADDRGRRYADLHKARGHEIELRLLPGTRYFVRVEDREYSVPGDQADISLEGLEGRRPELASKGAGIADAYARGLFSLPFGPDLVRGFELARSRQDFVTVQSESSHPLRTAAYVTGGAALVAGGVSAAMRVLGNRAAARYAAEGDLSRRVAIEGEVRAFDSRTNVALGAAFSLGVAALGLIAVDLLDF